MSKLTQAVREGNIQAVKALLAQGVDLNERSGVSGYTALMWAVSKGHQEILRTLIDAGVDLDKRDYWNTTALQLAKQMGQKEIVQLLKAAPKRQKQLAQDRDKAEAEFRAFMRSSPAEKIDKELLAFIAQGDCDQVRLVLERAFWRKQPLSLGWQHLKIALLREDKPMIRLLISRGAQADERDLAQLRTSDQYAHYLQILRQCGLHDLPSSATSQTVAAAPKIVDGESLGEQAKAKIKNIGIENAEIGDVMPDGSIYAGISPTTKKRMYVTVEDACLLSFNKAANYAKELEAHKHNDWRVPTKEELTVLFRNREKGALRGTFNSNSANPASQYWSSTAGYPSLAWALRFGDGSLCTDFKSGIFSVRCVRSP